jgi:hypothetical protein
MLDIREFDFRHAATSEVLAALDHGMEAVDLSRDGIELLEFADALLGIGCIALQAYITGACADLAAIFPDCPKRHELRARQSPVIADTGVSLVEAIWETVIDAQLVNFLYRCP